MERKKRQERKQKNIMNAVFWVKTENHFKVSKYTLRKIDLEISNFHTQKCFSIVKSLKVHRSIKIKSCILMCYACNQERPKFLIHWYFVANMFAL